MAQVNDLKQLRRKKKRGRLIKRFFSLLIIVGLIGVGYYTRDRWLPLFEGVVDKYRETIVNDGKLAEGNFPVKVSTSSKYNIVSFDSRFAVLTDTHFYTFESSGKSLYSKQHSMSNPIMKTSSKRALLYDIGGYTFTNENKGKTAYKKTLENQIIFAEISRKDYTAVVTKSDKYACEMMVYDENGKQIFFSSSSQKITGIEFNNDGTGCIATIISSKEGKMVTNFQGYKFDKNEIQWSSLPLETLVINSAYSSNGNIAAIGDTGFFILKSDGTIDFSYTYVADLCGYSTSGDVTAIIENNADRRKTQLTIIAQDKKPVTVEIGDAFKSVHIKDNKIFLMTARDIITYSYQGEVLATVELGHEYADFTVIDEKIYLLGASIIDRIDYQS